MGIELMFRECAASDTLDFEDFRKEVMADLSEVCGPEFLVESRDVTKNNGVVLHGLSVTGPDESVIPTIYLESLYDDYRSGNINVKEASNRILRVYAREKQGKDLDMYFITDFNKVREKIIFRLVNAGRNSDLLNTIPHRDFLDLAVTYTVYIDELLPCAGNVTVTYDLMKQWGTDENELFSLAMMNTPRIKKPVIKELSDMLLDLINESEADAFIRDAQIIGESSIRMFVLTNSDRYYGDSSILYPELLREFQHSMNCDLYLLPSSVHEFIIVPDTGNIRGEDLSELVKSVNETSVGEEEFLSDHVYLYKDHELNICF